MIQVVVAKFSRDHINDALSVEEIGLKPITSVNSFEEIISGVPQGSIVGSILFNIFFSDFFSFILVRSYLLRFIILQKFAKTVDSNQFSGIKK